MAAIVIVINTLGDFGKSVKLPVPLVVAAGSLRYLADSIPTLASIEVH
jgi:hypothetical protein